MSLSPARRAAVVAFWIVIAAPVLAMAVMLAQYTVNVPFWDQWQHVKLLEKLHAGSLGVLDLWAQHNEHRNFFPRIVMLVLASLTGYDVRFEVAAGFLFSLGTFAMLAVLLWRTFPGSPPIAMAVIAASAWVFYSPLQTINWIWGFQLAFFMAVFFTVATVALLTAAPAQRWHFLLAQLTALLATYSLGSGAVVWGVGLVVLLGRAATRRRIVLWIGVGGLASALYLHGFVRSVDSLPLMEVLRQPVAVARYLLTYLGRNVAEAPREARIGGAVLLGLFACSVGILVRHRQLSRALPWLALGCGVLCTASLASIARLNYGVDHAMANSYTTISVIFVISTLALSVCAASLLPRRTLALGVVSVLWLPLAVGATRNYVAGWGLFREMALHLVKVERCVYTATSQEDPCMAIIYPNTRAGWRRIQILRTLGWGRFGERR